MTRTQVLIGDGPIDGLRRQWRDGATDPAQPLMLQRTIANDDLGAPYLQTGWPRLEAELDRIVELWALAELACDRTPLAAYLPMRVLLVPDERSWMVVTRSPAATLLGIAGAARRLVVALEDAHRKLTREVTAVPARPEYPPIDLDL